MATIPETLPGLVASVARADDVAGAAQGTWLVADYLALPPALDEANRADGHIPSTTCTNRQRYEIIDGVIYMVPSPIPAHQRAVTRLVMRLGAHVEHAELGEVFVAPLDVELAPDVVVQPDVFVILRENLGIVTPQRIVGAPDLVIEVSSPGTAGYDRRQKQDAYARAGGREYWIADVAAQTVELLELEAGAYTSRGVFTGVAALPSRVVPGLPLQVAQFFA